MSSECLIPHRKEDYGGVLKIKSELLQLSLDNIIRGKKKNSDYKDGQTFANIDLAS